MCRVGLGAGARPAGRLGRIGILLARAQFAKGRPRHCGAAGSFLAIMRPSGIAGGGRLYGGGSGQHRIREAARCAGWKCSAGVQPPGGRSAATLNRRWCESVCGLAEALLDRKRPGRIQPGADGIGGYSLCPKAAFMRRMSGSLVLPGASAGSRKSVASDGVRAEWRPARDALTRDQRAGKILLWQRPAESKRLAGFWELPEREQVPGARVMWLRGISPYHRQYHLLSGG